MLKFESKLKDLSDDQYKVFMNKLDELLENSIDREIVTHSKYIGSVTFNRFQLAELFTTFDSKFSMILKYDFEFNLLLEDIAYIISENFGRGEHLPKFYDYVDNINYDFFEEYNDFEFSSQIEYTDIGTKYEVDTHIVEAEDITIEITFYTKQIRNEIASANYQIKTAKYKNMV